MFGFMRNQACEHHSSLASNYRLHYCGTCKTMGTLYGQRTRPLLNFDTVFLSELLAALGNEQQNHWNDSYQSKSCFQLPKNQQDMPMSLQFAATVNVLLAELKTEDNRQDGAKISSQWVQKIYSTAFQKAAMQMKTWGLDTDLLWAEMERQASIERHFDKHTDFAAPTANMTALIFEKGAEVVGNEAAKAAMYAFGKAFGEVIYWLDAFADYEKDVTKTQFNAIQAKYALKSPQLSHYYRNVVIRNLKEKEQLVLAAFQAMPLSSELKNAFCERFAMNLAHKLATDAAKENAFIFEWEALKHIWQTRKEQALSFAQSRISVADSLQHQVQLNAWLLAAFVAPNLPKNVPAPNGEKHSLTFWAVLVAFFGALGLGRKAVKTCKHGKKSHSYFKKIMYLPFSSKKDACGDCCVECTSDCCSQCIQECCESCCSSVCDSCCESVCNEFPVLGWILGGLILLGLIILLIILLV